RSTAASKSRAASACHTAAVGMVRCQLEPLVIKLASTSQTKTRLPSTPSKAGGGADARRWLRRPASSQCWPRHSSQRAHSTSSTPRARSGTPAAPSRSSTPCARYSVPAAKRSEERRVGRGGRDRCSPTHYRDGSGDGDEHRTGAGEGGG